MDPRYGPKIEDLERRLLDGPGTLDAHVRRAAAAGAGLPEVLSRYVDTVRRHAYRVTDGDVEALKAAGYSEDQLFELTVAAAYGAAADRLRAGLGAMKPDPAPAREDGPR
jgi:hypothetical protein